MQEQLLTSMDVDVAPRITVGPGCYRRDLPSEDGIRIWIVDMEPGSQWPHGDHHDTFGQEVFVVSGELIEGDKVFTPGTFLASGPDSKHQPRTSTGVRLLGFNIPGTPDRQDGPAC